ncbi:MAG: metabolite traffic protein EboE [Thermoflexibacter sp.]
MQILSNLHLSYCTNIHSGESWQEVFANLKSHILPIKQHLAPTLPFGIGLRLSDLASKEILSDNHLLIFRDWLQEHNCYVFTMNGFPFGNFHRQKVKDAVHLPDWTSAERLAYTMRLFDILAEILPLGIEGGISTSPISYKLWWKSEQEKQKVMQKSTEHILKVAAHLFRIREKTGKTLHLDIEPEPDGMLENTKETVTYFKEYLLLQGVKYLSNDLKISEKQTEQLILTHIQVCYDICHFAVEYENHKEALQKFEKEGIKIGKFQISAALKADLPRDKAIREAIFKEFEVFNESVYLHQVIAKKSNNQLLNFNDLPLAFANAKGEEFVEWRTHFHVPIFLEKYNLLQSTQSDIVNILQILKEKPQITKHLEIETYTWEVLPKDMRESLTTSIQRELEWVMKQMQ